MNFILLSALKGYIKKVILKCLCIGQKNLFHYLFAYALLHLCSYLWYVYQTCQGEIQMWFRVSHRGGMVISDSFLCQPVAVVSHAEDGL